MLRNVYLHGRMKKLFGGRFRLDVATPGEALRALHANLEGFTEALKEGSYHLIRGSRKEGISLGLEEVEFRLGNADFHLIPVTKGARGGKGGALKIVLGVALVGAAIFFSGGTLAAPLAGLMSGGSLTMWGNVALLGLGLAVSGIASVISSKEKPKQEISSEKKESFAFSGATNAFEQGNAVPVIVGEVITGGIPISAGIDVESIPV